MSAAEWLMRATQGAFNRMRSPKAADAADAVASGRLEDLDGRDHCLVVTYRRNGEAIPTPVWFGVRDGTVYFRSVATNGKVKRIRHTPLVRIAPCTSRGRPLGPPFLAEARILAASEEAEAERCIQASYGPLRHLYSRLVTHRVEGLYVAVTPLPAAPPGAHRATTAS
jgi:PPOX class probable F420-dependent enzyme